VVDTVALLLGWWWAPLVVAVAVSAALRGGTAFMAVLAGTLLAGTVVLVGLGYGHLDGLADLVGALAVGKAGLAWLVLTITYLSQLLLALVGAWFGGAARRLVLDTVTGGPAAPAPAHGPSRNGHVIR
jgi:hypothetical protein